MKIHPFDLDDILKSFLKILPNWPGNRMGRLLSKAQPFCVDVTVTESMRDVDVEV